MAIGTPLVGAMATNSGAGPIAPANPAGIAVGDVKHLHVYSYNGGNFPALSGWVLLRETDEPSTFGTAAVFRRVHQAGDAAPSITGPGGGLYGQVIAWRGADTTTPEDVAVPTGTTGVGNTLTAPGVTTATAGAVVAWYFVQGDDNTLGSPTNSATLAYGGASYSSTVGGDACMAGAYRTFAAAGASGTCSVTASGGQPNQEWIAITVAIRPAAVAVEVADTNPAGVAVGSPPGESVEALSINVDLVDPAPAGTALSSPAGEVIDVTAPDTDPAPALTGSPSGETVGVSVLDTNPAGVAVGSPSGESVTAEEPGLPAGGAPFVSLWGVHPTTGALVHLPHALKVDLSPIRNSGGSFRFDYPAFGKNFEFLHDRLVNDKVAVELQLWVGGSRFNSLGGDVLQVEGDDVAEESVWSFSGKFFTHRLARATVRHDPTHEKGERRFSAATAGTIMRTFLLEAQARGTLTYLNLSTFSATHDSAGVPWSRTATLSFTPYGDGGVLTVLSRLVALGMCEGEIDRDKRLLLYNAGGAGRDLTTRTPPVILRRAKDLLESNRRLDVGESGTDVYGTGGEGLYASAYDASARARWGEQIEMVADSNQIKDQGALTAFVQNARDQAVLAPMELTHGLVFGTNRPAPVSGFRINDWLYSDVGRGLERVRVAQWVLSQDVSGIKGSVTLNDVIADRLTRLQRQIAAMSDGSAVVGTSQPPGIPDTRVPAAPTGVVADSLAYSEGVDTFATVIVGWTAVTTNAPGPVTAKAVAAQLILQRMQSGLVIAEDWTWSGAPAVVGVWNDVLLDEFADSGSADEQTWLADFVAANSETGTAADDIAGYRVEWRPEADLTGGWRLGADTTATSTSFGGVAAGIDIVIRVFAYDRDGNVSAPSAEVVITTETDNTPPPVPSTPVVTPYLGQLKIAWDGLGSAGESMPADLDFVEVHLSTAAGFTPSAATLIDNFSTIAGERIATDLDYGVTYFARLVAVDRTTPVANRSDPSATGSGTPSKVVQIDIGPNAIGQQQIIDLEVITAKIDNLAVNDAKFGSGSFGKLTAGTISVAVTNAGIIRSGISGQRYELDAAALRFYNGAGAQTVQLNGASNWISGEIRTALSGARMVLNPGGVEPQSFRCYPTTGSSYAEFRVRTFLGSPAVEIQASGTKSGFLGVYDDEAFTKWGSTTESNSAVSCVENMAELWGPSVTLEVRGAYPNDGGARRVEFRHRNADGTINFGSLLQYRMDTGTAPLLYSPTNDLQITWAGNAIGIYVGRADGFPEIITAKEFVVSSSRRMKKGEREIRFGSRRALDIVAAVESRAWNYSWERTDDTPEPRRTHTVREQRRGPDGRPAVDAHGAPVLDVFEVPVAESPRVKAHFFPIAEDLALVAPDLVTEAPGLPGGLAIGMRDAIGVLWQAVRELRGEVEQITVRNPGDKP